jgi:CheY-like chemotaxis protein
VAHKLLLADDSITIQRVIELTFSGEDVQVVAVGDGDEAIARIPLDPPDIVLADIAMPKRSGYDVAAFIKEQPELAHIPVLLLAGAFEPVDEARARQVRCDGVLVKPFEPQQVVARVRELLRQKPAHAAVVPAEPPMRSPSPEPPPRAGAGDALEDYFDRLDAAFANLGPASSGAVKADEEERADLDVPTIDDLLRSERPESRVSAAPSNGGADLASGVGDEIGSPPARRDRRASDAAATAITGRSYIADAFNALLAAEQGEPGAGPVRLGPSAQPPVTDELVDEVTRRVLERLAPAAVTAVVSKIVSEVSEQLVREEIARIRNQRS